VGAEALPRAVRRVWSGLVSSGAAAAALGDAAPHIGATPPDSTSSSTASSYASSSSSSSAATAASAVAPPFLFEGVAAPASPELQRVFSVFGEMRVSGVAPDRAAFNALIHACAR